MARTLMRTAAFQVARLRGAVRVWRDSDPGRRDSGMTTLEVLIIAGALIALAVGAVALISNTAAGTIGSGGQQSPTSFLRH